MNGSNMLNAAEMVEHLDQTLTVSVSDQGNVLTDEPSGDPYTTAYAAPISLEMMRHCTRVAGIQARWLDRELSEGPPYCWRVGDEVCFTFPLRPRDSQLPAPLLLVDKIPPYEYAGALSAS